MNVSSFVLSAVLLAQGPAAPPATAPDPAPLVARLGSDDPAGRDAAASALRAIGAAALAPLRAARDGNVTAIQARAAALVRAIEGDLLIRPRSVALDYQDTPMREVIKDLTARTGCPVTIHAPETGWLATRITLRTPAPVPFWTAVDQVCKAGRFGSNLGLGGYGTSVALFRGYTTGPASNHGPFRVVLEEIDFHGRHEQLHTRADGDPVSRPIERDDDRENSYIELKVNVEPRMLMKNAGKLKGLSAVDDLGQSLIPADPIGEEEDFEFGFTPAAATVGRIPLARVEKPGKRVKSLRGVAPVVVAALRPETVVIPLLDAAGRSFRGDDTEVTILGVSKQAAGGRIVVVPVGPDGRIDRDRPRPMEGVAISLAVRLIDRHGPPAPAPEVSEEQFKVVDAAGKVWSATPRVVTGGVTDVRGGEARVTLRISDENLMPMPWPRDLKGYTLRYREMTVVPVDVPFEFQDVPLP